MSKVTQKHFRQPYRPSKVPLRPPGVQRPLLRYPCPNIFQITTIRCPYKIPFSCRIHFHSGLNPFIIKQHFQVFSTVKSYQSIDLMIIIHIFCYNCYILIFLLSLCQSPFIYRFRRGALNQGSLLKILFYASQLPTTPYQHYPYLLSTGA